MEFPTTLIYDIMLAVWDSYEPENIPMPGMVTMAAMLLPLQLVATILTVCVTL